MKKYFERHYKQKKEEFRIKAEQNAQARDNLLTEIAQHHTEQIQSGINLPDLDEYTRQVLGLVIEYRELSAISIPAEVEALKGNERRKKLAEFRREQRAGERLLRRMHGDFGFDSIPDMIRTIRSEIRYRKIDNKSKISADLAQR